MQSIPHTMRTATHPVLRPLAIVACALAIGLIVVQPAAARSRTHTMYSPMHADRIVVRVKQQLGRVPATWYGPGFWGNHTACGGKLRRRTWGIAHRTLPCGSLVSLRFGRRRLVVPVIDRGPYSGATIDLTQQTADYLRFRRVGFGRVSMSVVKRARHARR